MYRASTMNSRINMLDFRRAFLMLAWLSGFILGIVFASPADSSVLSLMRSAAAQPVSIVGLLVLFGLPFLFTAIAVYLSRPGLLIPLAFLKAFSFGFIGFGTELAFSRAGWLLRFLLLMPDLFLAPVLLWLWLRSLDCDSSFIRNALFYWLICAFIGVLYFCLVSPFLALL